METGSGNSAGSLGHVVAAAGLVSGAQDFLGSFGLIEVAALLEVPKDSLGLAGLVAGSRTCSRTSGLRAPVTKPWGLGDTGPRGGTPWLV